MIANPWTAVPARPPYVLDSDVEKVKRFNETRAAEDDLFLHVDELLPEPFLGRPDAPVLVLSNNPGLGAAAESRKTPEFMARMRQNLGHEVTAYPFPYLDPAIPKMSWWRSKLKDLLVTFGDEVVARSVCNVVYFPYPSNRYRHGHIQLPSQQYVFQLVGEAMRRGAVIVRMRWNHRWFDAVPGLEMYRRRYDVRNPQAATLNQTNFDRFVDVVDAIKDAEREGQPG